MSNTKPTFENFFALFEQPVAFNVNVDVLNKQLRQLQQQFHPDRLGDESATDAPAEQNSALINHAYHTLLNADSRATYLLELAGQEINVNDSISDLDFLQNAMELRIRLDESQNVDSLQALKSLQVLKTEIEPLLATQSLRFENAYDQEQWTTAIDATQKLKFLVKLQKDIDTAIDETHQQADDDDLYL